jgi:hypothetical protein
VKELIGPIKFESEEGESKPFLENNGELSFVRGYSSYEN